MKKTGTITLLILLLFCINATAQQRLISFVDPFIGTGGHGHVYPGATVPFGTVQLSPDNGTQGWDWCSGYHYSDTIIAGFSHTHLSGTGIGDLIDISFLPLTSAEGFNKEHRARFNHKEERANPGYYYVKLQDSKIDVELTAGMHVGYHRYAFPQGENAYLKIDPSFAINWDRAVDCYIKQVDAYTVIGYKRSKGWANNHVVHFAMQSNQPIIGITLKAGTEERPGQELKHAQAMGLLDFGNLDNKQLELKVGISNGSLAGAMAGLEGSRNTRFAAAKIAAENAWEKELGSVNVESSDKNFLTTFYTALYHVFVAPTIFNDAMGEYKGANGQLYHSEDYVYSTHSLWDTFRGANPLQTLLQPHRIAGIINSYLKFYDQYGLLPVWDLHFNETNTMQGYHAVAVIADAMLKGFKGFDYEKAYEAMKKSAAQDIRGTNFYRQYKYIPQDKYGYSVTYTMEYAYDDWCIAQVAKLLNKPEDEKYFMERSTYYRNLFDAQTGFFRGKNSDGKWVEPFDPYYSEHESSAMYMEGTAWQHTFFVPHAVDDYARLLGGRKQLIDKLDTLFTTTSEVKGENASNDISGMIGQYAHGNEPSHHIAYMYTYLGQPKKAAQRVHQIMTTLYHNNPDGLSGNEDCGQMSAWYVWSALGFYPMNASSGEYYFGTPLVDKATVNLQNGKTFTVRTVKGKRPNSIYINRITLNGIQIPIEKITHDQILEGGELVFYMTHR